MKEQLEWLHATDIESGVRTSVQVPKILLRGLPRKEPARSKFIQRLYESALRKQEEAHATDSQLAKVDNT
jgi:hypothetical protein